MEPVAAISRAFDAACGRDRPAVVPRLGPLPRRGRLAVPLALLVSAWVLLLPASAEPATRIPGIPGLPDLPGTLQYHWLIHQVGLLGAVHARLFAYPAALDHLVLQGFPLDALASWPFTAALGWPAGFTVFLVLTAWAAGLSMAWLAGRWWRSSTAALVAGVAFQAAPSLLREVAYGRPTQLFGAIFVPLAVGWCAEALVGGRRRHAVLAGVALALSALAYWYWGLFCGLAMLLLVVLAAVEGRLDLRVLGWMGLATVLVAGPMVLATLRDIHSQPGMSVGLDGYVHIADSDQRLRDVLEQRDLGSDGIDQGAVAFEPVLLALAVLGMARVRSRRWLAPLGWIALGLALAAGPAWGLSGGMQAPGPYVLLAQFTLVRRLWWPDRYLFLVALGLPLLAGGGPPGWRVAAGRPLPRSPVAWPRPC